jgi:hypothetical protein
MNDRSTSMATHTTATSTFTISNWDEQPFSEAEGGRKLTRASVVNTYSGDIEGEGTLTYLMVYGADGSASYIGLEQVVGRIGERRGSFVLEHRGVFEDGAAKSTSSVVYGSGSGDLTGLRGDGSFVAKMHEKDVPFTLDYAFE